MTNQKTDKNLKDFKGDNLIDPVSGEKKELKLIDILKGNLKKEEGTQDEKKSQKDQNLQDPSEVLIHVGYRMRNDKLRNLVERLRTKSGWDEKKLLEFFLLLDGMIEKAMITNNLLEFLINNPDILKQFDNDN